MAGLPAQTKRNCRWRAGLRKVKQYLQLMRNVLDNGARKGDRTGTGTLCVFGYQMRFDLTEGFPDVRTKKLDLRLIIHELLWFLKGNTNIATN